MTDRTGAERARRHREKLAGLGMGQVNLMVPLSAIASLQQAAERIRAEPHLAVGRLVDTRTGKLTGLVRKGAKP